MADFLYPDINEYMTPKSGMLFALTK